jgi:hypothetical protein
MREHRRTTIRKLFVGFLKAYFEKTGLAAVKTLFSPFQMDETRAFINVRTPEDSLESVYQITPYATTRDITVEVIVSIPINGGSFKVQDEIDAFCLQIEDVIVPYSRNNNAVEKCDLVSCKMGLDDQGEVAYAYALNLYTVRVREEYTQLEQDFLPALIAINARWDLAPTDGIIDATDIITLPE